jgi:type IV secretory pathway TraG/TraD family ATPase VirD4
MTSHGVHHSPAPLAGSDGAPWLILALLGGVVGMLSLAWLGGTVGTWAGGGGWHPPAYTPQTVQQLLDGQIEAVWPTGTPTWTLAGIASIALAATTATVLAALAATRRWGRGSSLARHRDLGRLTRATAPDAVRRLRPSLAHTRRIGADEAGLLLGDLHPSGREVRASWEDTVTAVMGPRARKSTALAVQALLRAPGPVVLTSNKADVYAVTTAVRAERGTVWTFDLQTIAHHPRRLWWDILAEASTLEGARRLASHFVGTLNDAHKRDFWVSSATNTLTALFAAAAHHPGGTVADVLRWLADATDREPVDRLKTASLPHLAEQLGGTIRGAIETRDGIYETTRQSIAALMDPRILAWVTPDPHQPRFDPQAFVASTDTVYLLSQDGIGSANGVVTAAVDAILQAGIRRAQRNGGRLDPPLVPVLDEAGNVVRIADLPQLMSHLGSRSITPLVILQSYAQGIGVWGRTGMDALWSASTVKLIGAGLDDADFVEKISRLVGEHKVGEVTISRGRSHRSWSHTRRLERILPASAVRALEPGRVLLFASGTRPAMLTLRPWFADTHADTLARYEAAETAAITERANRDTVGPR